MLLKTVKEDYMLNDSKSYSRPILLECIYTRVKMYFSFILSFAKRNLQHGNGNGLIQ